MIDAIRCAKIALDRELAGPIVGPSSISSRHLSNSDDAAKWRFHLRKIRNNSGRATLVAAQIFCWYNPRMTKNRFVLNLILLAVLLASCQSAPAAANPGVVQTAAFETAFAQISIPTETPSPTETPIPTATVPRTPPALPGTYQTSILKANDIPRTYVADTCQYLQNKWNPNNSAPGTVVMVIMSHRINQDAATSDYANLTIRSLKRPS